MDLAALVPPWLDALLIAPFRWPASALIGIWVGSAFLAAYAILIGELSSAALYRLHARYYNSMQDSMMRYHNISVEALHSGNKDVYLAANKLAQDDFGKSFFAQATIGFASLWPVPFALGWLALRFENITLYEVPYTDVRLGYVFVFLILYIAMRIFFSLRLKRHIPLFRRIEEHKRRAREARGRAKAFFNPPPETTTVENKNDARE